MSTLPQSLTDSFDFLWSIPLEDPYYKWRNGDLCVRWWFKDAGRRHAFDHIYLIEWDMLLLKPLAEVYGELKPACNYASLFGDYRCAKEADWCWIGHQFMGEVDGMLRALKEQGRVVRLDDLAFGIMVGCVLCREFLESYAEHPISSYSNDEVRLSVYSSVYGIPLINNGLLKDPRNRFDVCVMECDESDLERVLALGGSAVHPLRRVIDGIEEKIRRYQR